MITISPINSIVTAKNILNKHSIKTKRPLSLKTKNDSLKLSTTKKTEFINSIKNGYSKISFKGNIEDYKAKIVLDSQKEYDEAMAILQQAKKENFKDNINETGKTIRKFTTIEGAFNKIKIMREIDPDGLSRLTEFDPETLEIYEIVKYNRKKSGIGKATPVSYTYKDGKITSFCKDSKKINNGKWKNAEVILFQENDTISPDSTNELEQLEKKIVSDARRIQEEAFRMGLKAKMEYNKTIKIMLQIFKKIWDIISKLSETEDDTNTQEIMIGLNDDKISKNAIYDLNTNRINRINIGYEVAPSGNIYIAEGYDFENNRMMTINKGIEISGNTQKIKERYIYTNGEFTLYIKNFKITAPGNWQAEEVYYFENGKVSRMYKNFMVNNQKQESAIAYIIRDDKIVNSVKNWKNY